MFKFCVAVGYVAALQKVEVCVYCLCSGRVHGAAVSGIDTDRGIVAVEWFEKGETKGKEVSQLGTQPRWALIRMIDIDSMHIGI